MTRVSRGKVKKRTWTWQGKKRTAWYFDVISNGERVRRQYASQTEAETELDNFREEQRNPKPAASIDAAPALTLKQAVERYLAAKARKRTVAEDKRHFEHLKTVFGADTPLQEITTAKISAYRDVRLATVSEHTGRPLSVARVNRPLQALRHLFRLAHEEWELIGSVPKVKLRKEPQGRLRWLEPGEEVRLLDACRKSKNKQLAALVTVAMETGLRRGELLGLTWDRVDMTRGVLRLEVTKSGKRREVPMRQVVYNTLASLPGVHEGQVWRAGSIRTAFENAVAEARIEDLHFHDLRHHFASWYVMRGGQLAALQQILGHATLAMTMRYSHLSPQHLRDEMTRTQRRETVPIEPETAVVVSAGTALKTAQERHKNLQEDSKALRVSGNLA